MELLFDQDAPAPLRNQLSEHSVDTLAKKGGGSDKENSELLDLAEREESDVPGTTAQCSRHRRVFSRGGIGIVVMLSGTGKGPPSRREGWPRVPVSAAGPGRRGTD
ncbi:MAG: hypothetical protein OXN84_01470 [Albidovulum sp.]|nr:hypothetical protein [Albidovulum sp.]